jgi:hypothetical protein
MTNFAASVSSVGSSVSAVGVTAGGVVLGGLNGLADLSGYQRSGVNFTSQQEEILIRCFSLFDVDEDGKLTVEDLAMVTHLFLFYL